MSVQWQAATMRKMDGVLCWQYKMVPAPWATSDGCSDALVVMLGNRLRRRRQEPQSPKRPENQQNKTNESKVQTIVLYRSFCAGLPVATPALSREVAGRYITTDKKEYFPVPPETTRTKRP